MAKPDQKQLQEVMANYQRVLSGYFSKDIQDAREQHLELDRKKEEAKYMKLAQPMAEASLVGTVIINKDIMVN